MLQELLEVTQAKLGFIVIVLLTGPRTQISAKHFHGQLNPAGSSGCPAVHMQRKTQAEEMGQLRSRGVFPALKIPSLTGKKGFYYSYVLYANTYAYIYIYI